MWSQHWVSGEAYKLLEDLSEESFNSVYSLIGKRSDYKSIPSSSGINSVASDGSLSRDDVAVNWESLSKKLSQNYDLIDRLIVSIRTGVDTLITDVDMQMSQEDLHIPKIVQTTPSSVLEIENGQYKDNVFQYGILSVMGRAISDTIYQKMSDEVELSRTEIDSIVKSELGNLIHDISARSMNPAREFYDSNLVSAFVGVNGKENLLTLSSSAAAKISNSVNNDGYKLAIYSHFAERLAESGYFKELMTSMDVIRGTKVLF